MCLPGYLNLSWHYFLSAVLERKGSYNQPILLDICLLVEYNKLNKSIGDWHFEIWYFMKWLGAWFSGRMLPSRGRGRRFDPCRTHW